jgi:hypothetical protein
MLNEKSVGESNYQTLFSLYNNNRFNEVLNDTESIFDDNYKSKYLLIRALSLIKLNELDKSAVILEELSIGSDKISEEAKHILEAIKDPSRMEKANELAFTGSPYLYRINNQHMIIIVMPKAGVDVTYLKTLISDFHTSSIGNEVFEISALLLGADQHLLMIKSFENIKESIMYYDLFIKENSVMSVLNKSEHKIMSISFENFLEFYKNKDVDGYYNFFIKNYRDNN